MGKAGVYFVAVISFILVFTASAAANEKEPYRQWIKVSNAVMDANIKDVAVSKEDPDVVYIISDQAVYMTVNSGKSWSELLSFRATDNRLNTITLSKDANTVYVGTKDGLYMGMDRGAKWERIFRGIGELENAVYAVSVNALNNEIIIIGTMDGIYHTKDRGTNWSKGKNIPAHTIVTSIAADSSHQEILYACSSNGVYKSLDSGLRWSRVYELITPEEDYQYLFEDEDEDISQIIEVIKTRDILVGPAEYSNIYLATSNGLIISSDNGMSWINTGSAGLLTRNIKSITIAGNDMLYAATDRGVFRYVKDADRWQALTRGLSTFDIRSLDSGTYRGSDKQVLWSASGNGVYRTPGQAVSFISGENGMTVEEALSMFSHEPALAEIRQAAIAYAEVEPEKIRKWRKAAAAKALLPDLRVAYDDAKDWQSSTYFYKDTYEEQYLKDDDITRGHDKGWSVSLTWELGDLIWNSAQTTIDARSRLMVQLRDDILNEVTRLYFERRRMQVEMFSSPPADFMSRMDKELRLQELTAGIDALTGSYLSKRLGRK